MPSTHEDVIRMLRSCFKCTSIKSEPQYRGTTTYLRSFSTAFHIPSPLISRATIVPSGAKSIIIGIPSNPYASMGVIPASIIWGHLYPSEAMAFSVRAGSSHVATPRISKRSSPPYFSYKGTSVFLPTLHVEHSRSLWTVRQLFLRNQSAGWCHSASDKLFVRQAR